MADIVLAVTDVPAENRLLRQLNTFPKTVKDYRAIILKMCDISANADYWKGIKNNMYVKYQKEYSYKKYIFKTALKWYKNDINFTEINKLWDFCNAAHGL